MTGLSDRPPSMEEDAAVVIAILAALGSGAPDAPPTPPRSVWGSPAQHLGVGAVGRDSWWAAGLPR